MIGVINDRLHQSFEICEGEIHAFLNPYTYLCLKQHRDVLSEFDRVHFDGITLCWVYSLFGIRKVERRSFDMTSVANDVFEYAAREGKTVALIGTEEGVIDQAAETLQERFGFELALCRNGFFSSDEEVSQFQNQLCEVNPDVVVIGMGAVRQEQFLAQLKNRGWHGVGFTCGGFLHQTANRLEFYPPVFDRLNLRWLYRIWKDPYVFKRYLLDYPKFLLQFFGDFLAWQRSRSGSSRNLKPLEQEAP